REEGPVHHRRAESEELGDRGVARQSVDPGSAQPDLLVPGRQPLGATSRRTRLVASDRIAPMQHRRDRLVITCEHAGNDVPERYRGLFVGHGHLLPTHRGWDPGALTLAREMAARFHAPLYYEETTRLLVDLNRSVGNPELHSEATRHLSLRERREILDVYYHPHRKRVAAAVAEIVEAGDCVVQICSHSFTPELNGHVRTADIGMLYDPGRPGEVAFATAWIEALRAADPALRLRRNYPYIGKSDGVAQVLRRVHPADRYV